MRTIRVGTRSSPLAMAQTTLIIQSLKSCHPDLTVEVVPITTTGDRILDRPLDQIGGKGLFIKELDQALLDGRVDLCVHSYKDMPVPGDPALPVLATPRREDPRDVLVLPSGCDIPDFRRPVGTSSLRRKSQLAALYPEWPCRPVRGNVQTRLRKLDGGEFGALVLAAAGLKRMGLWHRVSRIFSATEMIPACCQGVLAVQGRRGEMTALLQPVDHQPTKIAALAERACIAEMDGGCSAPSGAYAVIKENRISICGFFVGDNGSRIYDTAEGGVDLAETLGRKLGERIRKQGMKGK